MVRQIADDYEAVSRWALLTLQSSVLIKRGKGCIGEAVKYLPDEVRQQHSGIDWRAIAGMRDRLIHHYFGIDYDIVWDVVINKVPQLDAEIREILNDIS